MFPKIRSTPKWMVKIMENPIKMDDLGVPLFSETSIYVYKHDVWWKFSQWLPDELWADFGRFFLQKEQHSNHWFYSFNSLRSTWEAMFENSENQKMHLVHTEPKKTACAGGQIVLQGTFMKKHPPNLCSHIHWHLLSANVTTSPSCSLDTLHVEFGKTIYPKQIWLKNLFWK